MAWLGRLVTGWAPQSRLRRFDARFQGITHLGNAMRCSGRVVEKLEPPRRELRPHRAAKRQPVRPDQDRRRSARRAALNPLSEDHLHDIQTRRQGRPHHRLGPRHRPLDRAQARQRRRAHRRQRPRRRTGRGDGAGDPRDRRPGRGLRRQRHRAPTSPSASSAPRERIQGPGHHRQQRRLHLGQRDPEDERRAVVRDARLPPDGAVSHPARRAARHQQARQGREGSRPARRAQGGQHLVGRGPVRQRRASPTTPRPRPASSA